MAVANPPMPAPIQTTSTSSSQFRAHHLIHRSNLEL
jgi:hypothetical protein